MVLSDLGLVASSAASRVSAGAGVAFCLESLK